MKSKVFTEEEVKLLSSIVRNYQFGCATNKREKTLKSLKGKIDDLFRVSQVTVTVE